MREAACRAPNGQREPATGRCQYPYAGLNRRSDLSTTLELRAPINKDKLTELDAKGWELRQPTAPE